MKEKGIEISDLERLNHELRQILHQALNADSPQQAKALTEKAQQLKIIIESGILEFKKRLDPYELNLRAEIAKEKHYSYVSAFSEEGIAWAEHYGINKKIFRFIDRKGNPISQGFDFVSRFQNGQGVGKLLKDNNSYSFLINEKGEDVVDPNEYSYIGELYDDRRRFVKKDPIGLEGFLDEKGQIVSSLTCSNVKYSDFSNGLSMVMRRIVNSNLTWEYIDKSGQKPFDLQFRIDEAHSFYDDLAKILKRDQYYFIDKKGTIVTPGFDYADRFSDGLCSIGHQREYFYINQDGKRNSKNNYWEGGRFYEGRAKVSVLSTYKDISQFMIDVNEERKSDFYKSITPMSCGVAWGFGGEISTIFDKEGNVLFYTSDFSKVNPFEDGVSKVEIGDQAFYIDRNGKKVF